MSDRAAWLASVEEALHPLADANRAAPMRAYMKGRFPFLGIPTPTRRQATRALLREARRFGPDELLGIAGALCARPAREFAYVAVDLLATCSARLDTVQVPAVLDLARRAAWWDGVDGLAGVVGDVLRRTRGSTPDPQALMDRAIDDPDFWVRRIALLHQLGWRADTDTGRLAAYVLKQAHEREFFIRKAIGWALRDYARHDPDWVRRWLLTHGAGLSALSRREAARHL